jgi:hypothetical protein
MAGNKNTAASLDRARITLKEIDEHITGLVGRRRERLLAGESATNISKIDVELEDLRRTRQVEADRAELLDTQLKREANERRLAAVIEKIKVVEADFALRDDAAKRAADGIKQLDAAFRDLFLISRRLREAWNWRNADIGAVMIGEMNIMQAIEFALYKIGGRSVATGGMAPAQDGPSLPGAKCPRLELMDQRDKIEPLETTMARASACASDLMRGGTTTGGSDGLQRGSSGRTLPALLSRMNELASGDVNDPANEAEYNAIVSELAQIDQPQQGAVA